jgi:hypothetical protein
LARLPEVRGNDSAKCHARTAQEIKPVAGRYSAFGAARRNGELFCISIPDARVVDVSDRPYFQRAVRYRDFAVGDYQIGRVTKTQVLSMAYPLLDPSQRVRASCSPRSTSGGSTGGSPKRRRPPGLRSSS